MQVGGRGTESQREWHNIMPYSLYHGLAYLVLGYLGVVPGPHQPIAAGPGGKESSPLVNLTSLAVLPFCSQSLAVPWGAVPSPKAGQISSAGAAPGGGAGIGV